MCLFESSFNGHKVVSGEFLARFVVKDHNDACHNAQVNDEHYEQKSDELVDAVDFVHTSNFPDLLLLASNLLCFEA